MTGTERNDSGASCPGTSSREADEKCIAADRGINEKSSMEMIKGLIAAPGSDSPEDGRAECRTSRIPAGWQGHIGAQLRALYGSLINEPVPDKFYHLLKELDAKEPKAIEQEDKS